MPRRDDDGRARAARAGAEDSLEDATAIMKALPQPEGEQAAKALDVAHFLKHPDSLSYMRPYHPGEAHPLLLLAANGGQEPDAVAVAMVCPGIYARVLLWPGMLRASGRRWAEEGARRERIRLGLQGQA
ncbi:hypothetical protein [Deinococcus sp.]|uniref:hypothetical protein n=1 Tax=Deinococcus sp. TaxID=47478 RepID=UPI003B59B0E9